MKMTAKPVPILTYHQVTPVPSAAFHKYTVTVQAFTRQMAWLARARYTPISLDTLVAARVGTRSLPERPVIITFDDGFRDCIRFAAPVLQKHHFTATFYFVAGLLGKTSEWLRTERGIEFELADPHAVRQLSAAGFSCAAHSFTHPHLADVSDTKCLDELTQARERLEQISNQPVRHLAYPFGSNTMRTRALAAKAGYLTACSVEIGLSTACDSFLALRRVPICGLDSFVNFICRVRTGWRIQDLFRSGVRRTTGT